MTKYYGYEITLKKGARFEGSRRADRSPWTFHCRAPDAETAKLTAARHFQRARTPMSVKPKTLVFLMSRMKARRLGRE